MRKLMACFAGLLLAVGCGRSSLHSESAVERAIQAHLQQNPHLLRDRFTTHVESISFHGDTAEALVKFQSKDSSSFSVEVKYWLQLQKDQWDVVSSTPMSGQGGTSHNAGQENSPAPAGSEAGSLPLAPSH